MSLSLWRIKKPNHTLQAFFIFCATVNAVYCTIWDLVMDWSLIDPTAKHPFLRDTLAYKQVWIYYAAIVIDPILRFNWIFYAIFGNDVQHSALLSFFIALSEVCRRGMWTIFRVENEHCTNVARFRAARDVPLPYEVLEETPSMYLPSAPELPRRSSDEEARLETTPLAPTASTASRVSGADVSQPQTSESIRPYPPHPATMRRRKPAEPSPLMRGLTRVGSIMHTAHAQDFERKRRPEVGKEELSSDEEEDEEVVKGVQEVEEEMEHEEEHEAVAAISVPEVEERWSRMRRHEGPSPPGTATTETVRRTPRARFGGEEEEAWMSSDAVSPGHSD
jgi:xenotropic and polytropic retrovirus receptor 1